MTIYFSGAGFELTRGGNAVDSGGLVGPCVIGATDLLMPPDGLFVTNPSITSEGEALGTLCVIDFVPRELTSEQQDALQILSRHVMAQLELRRRLTDFTRGDLPRRKAITALRLERRTSEESAARHSSASQ
jgi:hypothetical protein